MKALVGFLLLALVALAGGAQAQVVYREVVATGHGGDGSAALVDALETAIGQVTGQRLSTSTSLRISESTRGGSTQFAEDFRQSVEKTTRGVVKSYTVLESGTTAASGRAFVKIRAVVPTYKPSEQLKRMRLGVTPVSVAGQLGSNPDARDFAESVSAAVEAYLTQSRKFAMIDRRNTDASGRELNRVGNRTAPIEETVKLGMRVGADFIVLATLKEFAPQTFQERRVTGRVVERFRVPAAVDVRVIDVATGQIKLAQSYVNPGRLPTGMSLSQYAADIGADIGQVINTAIYPIAVVGVGAGQVTLNQGGETVQVGRVYRLVSLGRNLVDPYTKESLGQEETEVGRIEVLSVTDRTAAAKLISGELPGTIRPGALLARIVPDDPGIAVSVQATLPRLPGAPGGSAAKDDDW